MILDKTYETQDITNFEDKTEDSEVIDSILNGYTNGFSVLHKKYKYLVFSLVKKMIRNENDIEDIMQDVFMKAYKSLHTYNSNYSFSSWLYKIATNTCIDFIRKRIWVKFSSEFIDEVSFRTESYFEEYCCLPDSKLIEGEKRAVVFDAIRKLPDKFKKIITLRYDKELNYSDIAKMLDIPIGTVKINLFRAKKMLTESLKKHSDMFDRI